MPVLRGFGILAVLCVNLILGSKSVLAQAIDPRNGALVNAWLDETDPFEPFSLMRVYRSDRNRTGLFGVGWCTLFDMSVRTQDSTHLVLDTCASGDAVYRIVDPAHAVLISQPTNELNNVIERQGGIASFLSSKDPHVAGARLALSGLGIEKRNQVVFSYHKFTPVMQIVFDAQGRWAGAEARDGNSMIRPKLDTKGGFAGYVITSPGQVDRVVTFERDRSGRITMAHTPRGDIRYGYDNQGRLDSVQNVWKIIYRYEYDNASMLTAIRAPTWTRLYQYAGKPSYLSLFAVASSWVCVKIVDRDENKVSIRVNIFGECTTAPNKTVNDAIFMRKTTVDGFESIEPFGNDRWPVNLVTLFSSASDVAEGDRLHWLWCNCPGNQ